jgi:AcrR family transcriptional regulator
MSTTGAGAPGLRERKKRATRAALSLAAVKLTVERGFANVRVEDIAEAAGVSARTFNNYFDSKGQALVAHHIDRSLRMVEELRRRPASEALWEAVTHAVLREFEPATGVHAPAAPDMDLDQWTAGVRLMVAEPSLQVEFIRAGTVAQAELATAVAARTGTDADHDLYPKLVAACIQAAVNVAMQQWLQAGNQTPINRLMADALARTAAGLPRP